VLVPQEIAAGDTVEIVGLSIRLFEQNHGYTKSLGFRIGSFGYSTDVFELDEAALTVLEGVDTWVVGCFLRHDAHKTHANLDRVLAWLPRLRPRRTVLTHMGPDMDWSWLVTNLPAGVEPGHDGMALDLT
jgi:phosphoribosyl 1,2-cyclic phosphate phosphodiesterase